MAVTACSAEHVSQVGDAPAPGTPIGEAPQGNADDSSFGQSIPALLDQGKAYLATPTELRLVNVETGQATSIRPQHPPLAGAKAVAQPLLVPGGAASSVVWPFLVGADGQAAVELTTVGADGRVTSSPLVALPAWAANTTSPPEVSAVGSDHGVLVLNVAHSLTHSAFGIDIATGKQLWTRDQFASAVTAGPTVVGEESDPQSDQIVHVSGVNISNGQQTWTGPKGADFNISEAGPALIAVDSPAMTGPRTVQLLSTTNGAVVGPLPLRNAAPTRCVYDGARMTVCTSPAGYDSGRRRAVGIDANTGHVLWTMPNSALPHNQTSGGEAPLITAGWHGHFYGSTVETTVVYNGMTGNPERFLTGPSPLLVDDRTALSLSPDKKQVVARPVAPTYNYVPTALKCTACQKPSGAPASG
jgi:hypothetical protein